MKTGRPVKVIDPEELKSLMGLYPSLEEVAGWFKCSPDTIEREIRKCYEMSFAEFRNRFMSRTKLSLKRVAIEKALSGNEKMLIHCLRSLGIMDDRSHPETASSKMTNSELICEASLIIKEFEKSES